MLGPAKPRRLDKPITVSLEALVPRDNFYRHLENRFDLGFVRDWTRGLYAARGRPSIDPVVFFKLQLVMFFEGIRFVGSGNEATGVIWPHHHPRFDIDEAALAIGVEVLTRTALRYLV
jgi:hypothetical protein